MLHTLLRKFIPIQFTEVDTEGAAFDPDAVVIAVIRRLTVRM